jgi:hypothetical protein
MKIFKFIKETMIEAVKEYFSPITDFYKYLKKRTAP